MIHVTDLVQFGKLLKSLRLEQRRTQIDIATTAGISKQFYSELERAYAKPGKGAVRPSDENVAALANAFGVSATRLHAALGRVPDHRKEVEASDALQTHIKRYSLLSSRDQALINRMVDAMMDLREGVRSFVTSPISYKGESYNIAAADNNMTPDNIVRQAVEEVETEKREGRFKPPMRPEVL